ncbi:hypothetical protein [Plantibacter sp. CFBP 8804]|uniref:hypothetical protein n=1 Tax=Plantibacter sp. CFBP 8804 TaxID=2775270 RepID=UPI00178377E1|nr:hypothetical protein [Plantibacter sp. CFBP 8804]MBD8517075.1 hypothetical protein [Plantibacter sp. CFBP 8804]
MTVKDGADRFNRGRGNRDTSNDHVNDKPNDRTNIDPDAPKTVAGGRDLFDRTHPRKAER